tara:strand:+ start:116 stop:2095 length:1980 start_codon:yes stop_codon:yes gene_type:complete
MKFIKLFILLALFTNLESETVNTGHAEVSLVKFSSPADTSKNLIGIKMDMQKNWHTYWKNPGDSGGPIKVEWRSHNNIEISDIKWPSPQLIPYEPLMTYGYKDFVIFPFEYTNWMDGLTSYIEVSIDFLICDDICVPEKALIQTSLDDIPEDPSLNRWYEMVPSTVLPTLVEIKDKFINIRFSNNEEIHSVYFYIDKQNIVDHAAKQILEKEKNNWLLQVPLINNHEKFNNLNGVLSIDDSENYLVETNLENNSSPKSSINFLQALLFAFIGGLILNLMPCVFPIISLKILSFVSLGNESTQKIRLHALSFCFGVLISFLLIGLSLIILKQTGNYLGWGFQLQSPIIVAILSILMFVIGIILLTDINIGSSLTRLGSIGSNNVSGSFLTGILAVIVASPCTAPFMGAALGYALIQPSGITMPIFASLGIGFAMPYFILSMNPSLVKILPAPGEWMVTLKEFFAFPMFATALWLIWVFGLQVNMNLLISLLVSILIISTLFWFILKITNKKIQFIIWMLILTAVSFEGIYIASSEKEYGEPTSISQYSEYESWNTNIEEDFKNNNQGYLINFTAAWCITCQANDKIALSRPKVKQYLKENDIRYIVADWTNKNDEILKALEKYNRNGVPLYIYWKPGMRESKILPAILTEGTLLDILKLD